jgi:hypothetical protein
MITAFVYIWLQWTTHGFTIWKCLIFEPQSSYELWSRSRMIKAQAPKKVFWKKSGRHQWGCIFSDQKFYQSRYISTFSSSIWSTLHDVQKTKLQPLILHFRKRSDVITTAKHMSRRY